MHYPAGGTLPLPSLLSVAAVLTLLVPITSEAASREERLQVIKAGRRGYDPVMPKPAPPPPAQTQEQRQAEAWRRAMEAGAKEVTPKTKRASDDETYDLPKVVVRPVTKPIKRLPRTESYGPPRKNLKAEPFESEAGRDARLVQRHLSKVEQILIPLLGGSTVGTAREIESRKQKAADMDELASALELQEAAGRDPEEIKKLRAEYERLHHAGPR